MIAGVPKEPSGNESPVAFSDALNQTLHRSLAIANEWHHQYATLEHLLLALITDPEASQVMGACGINLGKLKQSLQNYLETEFENLLIDGSKQDAQPTAGFQRVIQRAVRHIKEVGRAEVTGAQVLVAIFAERESHAAYFLQEQDMTRYDAVNYISHGIASNRRERIALIIADENNADIEDWISRLVQLAGIEPMSFVARSSPGSRWIDTFNRIPSDAAILVVVTKEFRASPIFKYLSRKEILPRIAAGRKFIPVVLGRPLGTGTFSEFVQIGLKSQNPRTTAKEILAALDYFDDFDPLIELFPKLEKTDSPVVDDKKDLHSAVPEKTRRRPIPGKKDFTWQKGQLKQSSYVATDLTLGELTIGPKQFLNDYSRLVQELCQQLKSSNHSSAIKDQARRLGEEVWTGEEKWDPQTIDRHVRALFALLPDDDSPMNKLTEVQFGELIAYQANFRAIYPIVVDRERIMQGLSIPATAPLAESETLVERLDQSALIDSAIPRKLEQLIREIKSAEREIVVAAGESLQQTEAKRRIIFRLGIVLNSLWQNIKNPPELVKKIEGYQKLYDLTAPIFRKVANWLMLWS